MMTRTTPAVLDLLPKTADMAGLGTSGNKKRKLKGSQAQKNKRGLHTVSSPLMSSCHEPSGILDPWPLWPCQSFRRFLHPSPSLCTKYQWARQVKASTRKALSRVLVPIVVIIIGMRLLCSSPNLPAGAPSRLLGGALDALPVRVPVLVVLVHGAGEVPATAALLV